MMELLWRRISSRGKSAAFYSLAFYVLCSIHRTAPDYSLYSQLAAVKVIAHGKALITALGQTAAGTNFVASPSSRYSVL